MMMFLGSETASNLDPQKLIEMLDELFYLMVHLAILAVRKMLVVLAMSPKTIENRGHVNPCAAISRFQRFLTYYVLKPSITGENFRLALPPLKILL